MSAPIVSEAMISDIHKMVACLCDSLETEKDPFILSEIGRAIQMLLQAHDTLRSIKALADSRNHQL